MDRPAMVAGSVLGAVGGALSYYGGGRLAGVQFPYGEFPTLSASACSGRCCFRCCT